nr:hypothetical protein Q903MT_gene2153 [Picea sitchensis]
MRKAASRLWLGQFFWVDYFLWLDTETKTPLERLLRPSLATLDIVLCRTCSCFSLLK